MNLSIRTTDQSASALIGRFVETCPRFGQDVATGRMVRRALLDTVACALAGAPEPASVKARALAEGQSGPQMARIWSSGTVTTAEYAGFVNGVEGHVLDYDDVASPLRGHPSIAILPALVALAEARDLDITALGAAYAAGFKVTCRISRAIADGHYARGWHTTPTLAGIGAVVALCHLLRLDAQRTSNALGLALTGLAGTRGNFGTMAKSVQAGQAARMALFAVRMAEHGIDAASDALDGRQGLLALYTEGGNFGTELAGLGIDTPDLLTTGIEVKKYPLCYATHRAIDGLLDLKADHPDLTLAAVRHVHVHGSARAFVPLIHSQPKTGLEGKFSMEYAVAAALCDGAVNFASFEDAAVQRPEIQQAFARIEVTSELQGTVLPRWTRIELDLDGGERIERTVNDLRGSAELPLSEEALTAKMVDCCNHGDADVDGAALAAAILDFSDGPVRALVESIVHRPGSRVP